jgi:hypothetical protein
LPKRRQRLRAVTVCKRPQELRWLWLVIVVLVVFFVLIMQFRKKKENSIN